MLAMFSEILKSYSKTISTSGSLRLALQKSKRIQMIIMIAIPVIVQNIVMHFQLLIDRAFLGNLDPRYLSVIGNVTVPFNASGLFLVSVSTGLAIVAAQLIGAKRYNEAKSASESTFFFSSVLSGGIAVVWLIFADYIFFALGAESQVAKDSALYARIISIGLWFTGVEVTAAAILSSAGKTLPIMLTGLLKNFLNFVLDYVMIFGCCGFPAMGLEGAAWATVIANVMGAIVLSMVSIRHRGLPFKINMSQIFRPKIKHFVSTMKIGLPSGFESFTWFAGQLVLVRLVNGISPLAMGQLSLVLSINQLALFVYLGFARSAMTLVGQYTGARNVVEAKKAAFECQFAGFIISCLWSGVMIAIPSLLLSIFTRDQDLIQSTIPILRLSSTFIVFQVINVITGNSIRATGNTYWMLCSQIGGTIFVICAGFIGIKVLHAGLFAVIITLAVDEGIRGLINLRYFFISIEKIAKRAEVVGG